jgi:hypothetical protein
MSKSFRKNPRAWWRVRNAGRAIRAKIKALDPDMDIDYGYYRKLDPELIPETDGWRSWEKWLAMNKAIDPDMDAVDEWILYQDWLKSWMRK